MSSYTSYILNYHIYFLLLITLTLTFTLNLTATFTYNPTPRPLLEALHASYALAHPALSQVLVPRPALTQGQQQQQQQQQQRRRKIRVGFVSAHFRRHSVCKLFCHLATHLDPEAYHVVLFSALQESFEDTYTGTYVTYVLEVVFLNPYILPCLILSSAICLNVFYIFIYTITSTPCHMILSNTPKSATHTQRAWSA